MANMIAMKRMTYGTRRLKAGDPFTASRRDARVLDAIGKATYGTRDLIAAPVERQPADDMQALRARYQEVVGKRPFPGWDAAELQRRMDEASAS